MTDIHIDDLATPEFDDFQRSALDFGETLTTDFSPEGILSEASAALSLTDYGPDDFRERLALICDEWDRDEGLTGLGRFGLRNRLLGYAKNRLLIQDMLSRHPEIHDEQISKPIIVIGLPRTGTTHLLNLLAADSRLRAMPLWESYEPVPTPGEATLEDGTDPRYQRCADAWAMMEKTVPLLAAMHPMDPDHINEEIELMLPNFASYNFEWFTHSPRYRDHYLAMPQLPHYEYMRTVLKLLQFQQPSDWPRRWVLKSPMHLENIPELQAVFPDATFVVTHRDPVSVIQSTITMLAYGQRMNRKQVLIKELADYWSERVEHLLRRCAETRHLLPETQSIDVPFHEFMADDMGMVAKIYDKAGLALDEKARAEMQGFVDSHPRGKHGRIIYDLKGDFGVDPAMLRERFQFYFDEFPVKAEA
jgi:hypothetical protein